MFCNNIFAHHNKFCGEYIIDCSTCDVMQKSKQEKYNYSNHGYAGISQYCEFYCHNYRVPNSACQKSNKA